MVITNYYVSKTWKIAIREVKYNKIISFTA